jgi:hypothetical protein
LEFSFPFKTGEAKKKHTQTFVRPPEETTQKKASRKAVLTMCLSSAYTYNNSKARKANIN